MTSQSHQAASAGQSAAQRTYAFDNARPVQQERLGLLAELLDEDTFARLARLGAGPGWHCLEVGAGGGSVAAWLARQVEPTGFVLATDLDLTVMDHLSHPCLEKRRHDIQADPLPTAEFDLVHARLLLAWLADARAGLSRMVSALRPGGCLLTEEMDFRPVAPDPRLGTAGCELFGRVLDAHHRVLAERHAFEPFRGRQLAGDLSSAGLADIGSEGKLGIWQGGQPGGRLWQLTLIQLREELAESGLVTAVDVDAVIDMFGDPQFRFMSQVIMAAWGYRRPARRRSGSASRDECAARPSAVPNRSATSSSRMPPTLSISSASSTVPGGRARAGPVPGLPRHWRGGRLPAEP
jgi:SAM-dependent methyltransferase